MILDRQHETRTNGRTAPGVSGGSLVGVSSFSLVDAARQERFNVKSNRHMDVVVWYPAEKIYNSAGASSPALELPVRESKKTFFTNWFGNEKNHTRATLSPQNLPVSSSREKFPVLLFSHDLGLQPESYTQMMECLASEGYIVFSINHAYYSSGCATASVRGRVETVSVRRSLKWRWKLAMLRANKIRNATSVDQKWTLSKKITVELKSWAAMNSDLTADRSFLLNFLEQLNSSFLYNHAPYNLFARRLDLQKIGVIGHGWGGNSAVQSLHENKSIKAAVNLDGFQLAHVSVDTLTKPLLMIYSERFSGINDGIYFTSADVETHTIPNSLHYSFRDPQREATTSMPSCFYETLNLVVIFFDRHVKQVDHLSFNRVQKVKVN